MRFLWLLPLLCTLSCSAQQAQETSKNLADALVESVKVVAKDPTLLFSPTGVAALVGLTALGFFSREAGGLAKKAGKKAISKVRKTPAAEVK